MSASAPWQENRFFNQKQQSHSKVQEFSEDESSVCTKLQ